MMFTGAKSFLACASVFLALAAQTSAHACSKCVPSHFSFRSVFEQELNSSPALGVKGTPKRSDVQRPSTAKPCGTINPATTIDTSTAVAAGADGSVTFQVVNCASISYFSE